MKRSIVRYGQFQNQRITYYLDFSNGFSNFKNYNGERTLEALLKFIASDEMNGGAIDNDVSFEDYDKTTGHDEW